MEEHAPTRSQWPRHAAAAVRDLRGALRFGLDLAQRGLDRVEAGHLRLASVEPRAPGLQRARPGTRWGTVMYRTLRGGAEVGAGALDLLLATVQATLMDPRRDPGPPQPQPARDATLSALNALVGDHLHRTDNPLALPLRLLGEAEEDSLPPRVLVLLHDLGRTGHDWRRTGPDSAAEVAQALHASLLEVQYNSGRHVSGVARELATELQVRLARRRAPPQSIAFVGHGLGGLLARSTWHQARALRLPWAELPVTLVFLGTPHTGAPLAADPARLMPPLAAGRSAALLAIARAGRHRSGGLEDFANGWVLPADRRTGLVAPANPEAGLDHGARAYAIAGAVGDGRSDGLVPVESALARPAGAEPLLPESHGWVAQGVDHAGLPQSAAVWAQVRHWLSA